MNFELLFSEADIDLLKLLRWCRHLSPGSLKGVFSETEIGNLMALGFVKLHGTSGSLVLTASGHRFLDAVVESLPPGTPPSYRPGDTLRRLRLAQLAVTAYRAGIDLFMLQPEELASPPTMFFPSVTRGRGSNVWGNTRVAAIAHLGDLACAFHYVCPDIGKLSLNDELAAFHNSIATLSVKQRAFVFAGESYENILQELEVPLPTGDNGLLSYKDAYRLLRLPVFLLPCDDTGAMQLRILSVPGYRQRLTKAALKSQYHPPPENIPAWDAFFRGIPFVLAVDMDLRRIDAAIEAAKANGYPQIAMAALEGQAEAVLYQRYRDTGKARVFSLTDAALSELFGAPPALHTPSRTQFLNSKGDVINAPLIQARGKTRT